MNRKKVIKQVAIGFASLIILIGSLFIPRSVDFPNREVRLGYPIHFFRLDFSGNQGGTTLSGAPDLFLKSRKFNILSAWEEFVSVSWTGFISSHLMIFFVFESGVFVLEKIVLIKGKK